MADINEHLPASQFFGSVAMWASNRCWRSRVGRNEMEANGYLNQSASAGAKRHRLR